MAVYTFKCEKCNKDFEKEMTFEEYDEFKKGNVNLCECGGNVKRTWIMDSLITHYACGGFYDTDSKTGSYRIR